MGRSPSWEAKSLSAAQEFLSHEHKILLTFSQEPAISPYSVHLQLYDWTLLPTILYKVAQK
jgi:hypothetical protein